jgi:hypothetical protein
LIADNTTSMRQSATELGGTPGDRDHQIAASVD